MTADVDPALCPLCGRANGCAVVAGRTCAQCWCAGTTFDAERLQRVPTAARDRACLCAACSGAVESAPRQARPGQ